MAEINQIYEEFKVNELPVSGLKKGDKYHLNVGNNKYKTFIVSNNLDLIAPAGAEFIEKDTMSQFRAISEREIWAIQQGYYKGVRLNGYYSKGDTPAPIEYYLSNTTSADDGGAIISVGDIRLESNFVGRVDVQYYGVIGVDSYTNIDQVPDRSEQLQLFEDYRRSKGLLGILNNLGHIRINTSIQVTDNINWINEGYRTGIDSDRRFHVYSSSLFSRKSGGTSTVFGKVIGLNIEKKSIYSLNTPEGRLIFTSSRLFDNVSLRSFELGYNTVKHFGTIVFGGISNLSRIQYNRFHSIWFALIASYSNGTPYETASTDSITDSYVSFNYLNFEVQGEETSLFKGVRAGHITYNNNFSDFAESVIDNSVVSLAQYWTQCLFKDNIFDYFINFSKGGLYNCDIRDNYFMNMTVKAATIFNPPVNWGLYGSERVKTMEWGLFKNPSSFYGVTFSTNTVANVDFFIKNTSPIVIAGLTIKDNLWIKPDTDAGRNSSIAYSKQELRSKIKVPSLNNTVLLKGQINDLSDIGYITDRISDTSVMYDKANLLFDSYYQAGIYNSNLIDDIKAFSIIDSTTLAKKIKVSTSGKLVAMNSKPDLKVTGRKYAFEISDSLVNNRLYEGDQVYCVELGPLTYSSGKMVDSSNVQRIFNSAQLVAYTGSENVLAYVYDLGSFVQLFNSTSKPWRGNNVLTIEQIINISSSMNLVGTTLPTQNLVPDRPFIQVDGSNNILGLYKVNSDYNLVAYDPATKIRYEELLRDYGIQTVRPRYFVPEGFEFYNNDTNKKQIFKAGSWVDIISDATTTVKGIVNQSANVTNSTATLPTSDTDSSATDVAGVVADLNDLIGKYNTMLTLVTELQSKLNSKLTNDRTSGQQSST